jgi:hypothetical protein
MPPPKKTTTRVNIVFMPYQKSSKSYSFHINENLTKEEKIKQINQFLKEVL